MEAQDVNNVNEIEVLKAKITELENKINGKANSCKQHKPKREYEPCECEICHKTLKNKFILKTHMKNMHAENRQTFKCPYCDKELKSKYYLQRHVEVVHADELEVKRENERNERNNVTVEVVESN